MDITKKIDKYINEASGGKAEYQAFFNKKLKAYGVSSPDELDDAKKKKFFDEIEKEWTGDK